MDRLPFLQASGTSVSPLRLSSARPDSGNIHSPPAPPLALWRELLCRRFLILGCFLSWFPLTSALIIQFPTWRFLRYTSCPAPQCCPAVFRVGTYDSTRRALT